MNKMLVPMFLLLLLLEMIIPVMSVLNSVQAISFAQWRKTQNGELMCALDQANETMSSSDCSLSCARDATCKGINIKNSTTCDVYSYQPKIAALVPDCKFLQVAAIANCFIWQFETFYVACSLFIIRHFMQICVSFPVTISLDMSYSIKVKSYARDSMLSALYAIARPSVCPSVCRSVCPSSVTRVD